MSDPARLRRSGFIALGAAAALAPRAAGAADPALIAVPDLRFGQAPLPPAAPGYDPAGDAKALILAGTPSPATAAIPGRQAVGALAPDHRYVFRIPDAWNGKLVVIGTPATRSEFANDLIWGEYLLAHGYAYACSNKGVPYNTKVGAAADASPTTSFPVPFDVASFVQKKTVFTPGALVPAKVTIKAWNDDFAALTRAAKGWVRSATGKPPARTYAVGLSNGGMQVRSLLENHPDLVDGGVDWSGVFWSPQQNFLLYFPPFLKAMRAYAASGYTDTSARAAIVALGYPDDRLQSVAAHPSLYADYYSGVPFYTDFTLWLYALMIDPIAKSSWNTAVCTANADKPAQVPATCSGDGLALPENRATYALSPEGRQVIGDFTHFGNIGKPLISIAGSADAFITPKNNALPYLNAVRDHHKDRMYWQYIVDGGTHVDTFAAFGYGLQPQLPFAWRAFEMLEAVVEKGATPSGAGTSRTVKTVAEMG